MLTLMALRRASHWAVAMHREGAWKDAQTYTQSLLGRRVGLHGLGAIGQLMPALASMITDGLFDRLPALKVVAVESGCGWAAYLMDKLDAKHEVLGALAPRPLRMKPSDYVRRNCWFVADPDERGIGAMLELVGEDRILWGSDYPHIDASLDAPARIRRAVAGLSPARQAAVLGGNAAALFGLDA